MLKNAAECMKDLSLLAKHGYRILIRGNHEQEFTYSNRVYLYDDEASVYIGSVCIGRIHYDTNDAEYVLFNSAGYGAYASRKAFFNKLFWDRR